MKALLFVLMTLIFGACASPARHPIEEGGSLSDFKRPTSGPDRYQAGYFEPGSTRR